MTRRDDFRRFKRSFGLCCVTPMTCLVCLRTDLLNSTDGNREAFRRPLWEDQEVSVLLVSDDKVTVQSARLGARGAPELQRLQSQRLH
jgi:hypothetical protein